MDARAPIASADETGSPRQYLLIAAVFATLGVICLFATSLFCGFLGARNEAQMQRLNYLAQSWTVAFTLCFAASIIYLLRAIRTAWFDLNPS